MFRRQRDADGAHKRLRKRLLTQRPSEYIHHIVITIIIMVIVVIITIHAIRIRFISRLHHLLSIKTKLKPSQKHTRKNLLLIRFS
ncbi:hypothetical protein Hanom_Chr11g01029501 [Helianthus anomalus]